MKVAEGVTKTNWKTIGLALLVFPLGFLGLPQLFGLTVLVDLSGGLINQTLLNTVLGTLVVVGVVAIWYGGLTLRDLGLVWSKLPIAVALTLGFWLCFTAAQVVYGYATGDLSIHPDWSDPGVTETLGLAIGYLFGNATFEELAFRGFILVQLYLLLDSEWWQTQPRVRSGAAIVGSSLPFTILHVPVVLLGEPGVGLGFIFGYSVALALVYIRTRNIFLTIGVHALANFPMPIFAIQPEHELLVATGWLVPALVVMVLWPKLPFSETRD